MAPTPRKDRPPVTRDRIVEAAIAVADEKGLDGLSMRAVGARLGVEAMSLYHHVRGREDVLDGIVDRLYAQFHDPVAGRPWKDELRRRSHSARDVIRGHPWSIPLMNSRAAPGLGTLRHLDAVIGLLRGAGFSLELTGHAFALVDAHLYGYLAQEVSLPFLAEEDHSEAAGRIADSLDLNAVPHLAEFVSEYAMQPGYDFGAEFDYGLDLVLDSLERELAGG